MIASADGRATVAGRSVALGHPADSPLLRELRTAVDAILVGTGTLRAEGYANLLDDDQRERRGARGGGAPPPRAAAPRPRPAPPRGAPVSPPRAAPPAPPPGGGPGG